MTTNGWLLRRSITRAPTRLFQAGMLVLTLCGVSTGVRSSCPQPTSPSTFAYGPWSFWQQGECVFRAAQSPDGDYAVACRSGETNSSYIFGYHFSNTHSQSSPGTLVQPYQPVATDIDLVDAGIVPMRRWIPQWQGRSATSSYVLPYFNSWSIDFSTLQSNATKVYDNPSSLEYSRYGNAVDVLPSSRRLVHVGSYYRYYPANACSSSIHREWRVALTLRESSSLNVIANFQHIADTCSYNVNSQGANGSGQEYPDVSTSWFFGDFFVVTWQDRTYSDCGVYARVFNSSGSPLGPAVLVDDADPDCAIGALISPRVAAAPTGFMVTWTRPANQQVYFRTFDLTGNPYVGSTAVNSSTFAKGMNPDIDVAFVDPCGDGAQAYFAISWWSQTGSDLNSPWAPQVMVYRDLSNPIPIIPGAGYIPVDTITQPQAEGYRDRVSVDFFNDVNAAYSACVDLTLGLGWTLTVSSQYELWRKRVVRLQPICELASGVDRVKVQGSVAEASCREEDGCFEFPSTPRSLEEPELVFPRY